MLDVVSNDVLGLCRDGSCDDMNIALIRHDDGVQRFKIRRNICPGERLLHFVSRVNKSRHRVAKLLAAIPDPFLMDCIGPHGAECAGLSDPQQKVANAAPEQYTCIENGTVHVDILAAQWPRSCVSALSASSAWRRGA